MREIKFRAWDKDESLMTYLDLGNKNPDVSRLHIALLSDHLREPWGVVMQFTGLHDKNGLTNIYEGDILDENGLVKGNVYESPQIFREGIDCIITGMGTSAWRSSESIAMGRGCKYTE